MFFDSGDGTGQQIEKILVIPDLRNFVHLNHITVIFGNLLIERNAVMQKLFKPPHDELIRVDIIVASDAVLLLE